MGPSTLFLSETEGGEALQNVIIIICQLFVTNREVTYPFIAKKVVVSRLTMPRLRLALVEDYRNTFYPQSRRRRKYDFLKNLTRR